MKKWLDKWLESKSEEDMAPSKFKELYVGEWQPCCDYDKSTGTCASPLDRHGCCACGQIKRPKKQ